MLAPPVQPVNPPPTGPGTGVESQRTCARLAGDPGLTRVDT